MLLSNHLLVAVHGLNDCSGWSLCVGGVIGCPDTVHDSMVCQCGVLMPQLKVRMCVVGGRQISYFGQHRKIGVGKTRVCSQGVLARVARVPCWLTTASQGLGRFFSYRQPALFRHASCFVARSM